MDPRWAVDPATPSQNSNWHPVSPRLRFLLGKAGAVSHQPHAVMPQFESWVDESESIVLIGEAAHPQGVRACHELPSSHPPLSLSCLSVFLFLVLVLTLGTAR